MYQQLSDEEFLELIFTSGDKLGLDFVEEAKRRRKALVPLLCEVLEDEENYGLEDEEFWGVIHAVHLLGILGDPSAIEALFTASAFADDYEIDWIWEALPECYCRMGTSVIPILMQRIDENKEDDIFNSGSEHVGLWNLWEAYPEQRADIEDFLIGLLGESDLNPELRGHLIADFAQLGREEYRPWFEEMFDKGEVDLLTISREDLDYFFTPKEKSPLFHRELEKFYDAGEIEKRQQRWREEQKAFELKAVEDEILRNYTRIGRNEKCPCGSGKKFKKCHLSWAEEESRRLVERDIERTEYYKFSAALHDEKEFESSIRRFLARKNQTALFSKIQEATERIVGTPEAEFLSKGLGYYLEPILSEIVFEDKSESDEFMGLLSEYVGVCSFLHENRMTEGKQEE
jgi:hypothetical protein